MTPNPDVPDHRRDAWRGLGTPSPSVAAVKRRHARNWFLGSLAVRAGLVVISVAVTVVLAFTGPSSAMPAAVAVSVGLTIVFLVRAAILAVGLLVRRTRAGRPGAVVDHRGRPAPASPLWELPRRERVRLVRAMRRGEQIAPEQLDLARRAASYLAPRLIVVAWVYTAGTVISALNAILFSTGALTSVAWVLMAAVFLAGAAWLFWSSHRLGLASQRLGQSAAGASQPC